MSPITITLIITLVMAVLLVYGKFPFGLVTMASALALIVTGVLSIQDAMAGFSNNVVLMVGAMFCLSAALQKTNVPYALKGLLGKLDGKNDTLLVFAIVAVNMIMEIFLPGMVCTILIVSFLQVLPKDSEVTPSRIILPLLMIGVCWEMAVPIGLGATLDYTSNLYVEGIVTNQTQLLQIGNIFMVRIFPTVLTVLYVLFIWKRMPKKEINMDAAQVREIQKSALPRWKEYLVYAMFAFVFLVLIFNSHFGMLMYIIPAVCVVILGFTGIMNRQEIINSVASDTVWMLVGILGVTAALTSTGAANVVGTALVPLISWTENTFLILLIVGLFTAAMTTFLSNMGTVAVLTPLVASAAVAAGMDPRSLIIMVAICSTYAFCFPSGSTACAFIYSLGQYNPFKMLKYNLPLLLILVVATAISANFFFPAF